MCPLTLSVPGLYVKMVHSDKDFDPKTAHSDHIGFLVGTKLGMIQTIDLEIENGDGNTRVDHFTNIKLILEKNEPIMDADYNLKKMIYLQRFHSQ
ncbi:hypothetical protein CHS0354_011604, partial [Potamilus streckersoni]